MSRIQARHVGNAVFLEHVGCSGDVAAWGEQDEERGRFVAKQINLAILETAHASVITEAGTDFSTWDRGNLERLAVELTAEVVRLTGLLKAVEEDC